MLWYVLRRDLWGNGYIPEAARALVDFGFRSLKLHRVLVDCDPGNLASLRVAEKLGLRREAHFIENYWFKGAWCDSVICAVLEREWLHGQ
jgi:RimJ/RimL family protein N-acetyltransferase